MRFVKMDRGYVFARGMLRNVVSTTVCHSCGQKFVTLQQGKEKNARRAVFVGFASGFGRDEDVFDCWMLVIDSGITQEFCLRRLGESRSHGLCGLQCC